MSIKNLRNCFIALICFVAAVLAVWIFIEGISPAKNKAKVFFNNTTKEFFSDSKAIRQDTEKLREAYKEWEDAAKYGGDSDKLVLCHLKFMDVVDGSDYFSKDGNFLVQALKQHIEDIALKRKWK